MTAEPVIAEIVLNTVLWVAAGPAPFQAQPVSDMEWMVADRDGSNCVGHAKDGLRGLFSEAAAALICRKLNEEAGL